LTLGALAASAAFGLFGGGLAGLFGIGGGAVLVPFLYAVLGAPGWSGIEIPDGLVVVVAHATSLAVIVPTSLAALWGYHRSGGVPWGIVGRMGTAAALAAILASRLAPELPEVVLRGGFTLFLFAVGVRMLLGTSASEMRALQDERRGVGFLIAGGVAAGLLSSLLGVGGGLLAIPFLVYGVRIDLTKLAAASMGVVALSAAAGALSYAFAGAPSDLPAGSVGFIYAPLALALMPGAIGGARLGVRLNRRLGADRLRVLFALLLLVLACRLAWGIVTSL
jgi:uncharacterized membrane protein YfcA